MEQGAIHNQKFEQDPLHQWIFRGCYQYSIFFNELLKADLIELGGGLHFRAYTARLRTNKDQRLFSQSRSIAEHTHTKSTLFFLKDGHFFKKTQIDSITHMQSHSQTSRGKNVNTGRGRKRMAELRKEHKHKERK